MGFIMWDIKAKKEIASISRFAIMKIRPGGLQMETNRYVGNSKLYV